MKSSCLKVLATPVSELFTDGSNYYDGGIKKKQA